MICINKQLYEHDLYWVVLQFLLRPILCDILAASVPHGPVQTCLVQPRDLHNKDSNTSYVVTGQAKGFGVSTAVLPVQCA